MKNLMSEKESSFASSRHGLEGAKLKLTRLRELFAESDIDGIIIPKADEFNNEYPPECNERLHWLTGFTGSGGFAVVLHDRAALFTDSRYFDQALEEVDGDQWAVVQTPESKITDWLPKASNAELGVCSWMFSASAARALGVQLADCGWRLAMIENDPIGSLWFDRPPAPKEKIVIHPLALAGEKRESKIRRLGETLRRSGANTGVLTAPESVCWLANIRGEGIPWSPLPLVFGLLHADGAMEIFVKNADVDPEIEAQLQSDAVSILPMDDFETRLEKVSREKGRFWLDTRYPPSQKIFESITRNGGEVVNEEDITLLTRAKKNAAEKTGMAEAQLRDSVVFCRLFAWLEGRGIGELTEWDIICKLRELRAEDPLYMQDAFPTICAVGANGARAHYMPGPERKSPLKSDKFLLIDTGAHYLNGTTDTSRTIYLGVPGAEERRFYTLVLKALINLSMAVFPTGVLGAQLDALARAELWRNGLDFSHGTGHGVGCFTKPHELSHYFPLAGLPLDSYPYPDSPFTPDVCLTIEPGYYQSGQFGIRLENVVLIEKAVVRDEREFCSFRTLTAVPFYRPLIDDALLEDRHAAWLNSYHQGVLKMMLPQLTNETERSWLTRMTEPLKGRRETYGD